MSKIKNKKGRSLNLSASAVSAWEDCPRKWGFSYLERLETPKSESLEIGLAVHDTAEAYLLSGEVPDNSETNRWWRILQPGLDLLPSPVVEGEGMLGWSIETWLTDTMCGPLSVKGKIDFWQHTEDALIIGDWKTTKDSRWRWSKTPDQLADLTQPLLYAYSLGEEHGRPPRLDFQHINLCVKGSPSAMDVWARDVSWDAVDERWGTLVQTAKDMASYAIIENIMAVDLPPNIKSCKKYGGCPHAAYCPASHINRHRPLTPAQQQKLVQQSTYNPDNRSTPMADLAALRASLGLNKPTPTPAKSSKASLRSEEQELIKRQQEAMAAEQSRTQTPAESAAEVMEALRPAASLGIPRKVLLSACDAKGVPPRVVIQGLKLQEFGDMYLVELPPESTPDEVATSQAMDDMSESMNPVTPTAEPVQDKDAPAVAAVVAHFNHGYTGDQRTRMLKAVAKEALGVKRMGSKRWAAILDAATKEAQGAHTVWTVKQDDPPPPPRRIVDVPQPEQQPEEEMPKLLNTNAPADTLDTTKEQVQELGKRIMSPQPCNKVEVFVDCAPSGENTTSIIQVLQQHMEQVERDQGVAHYSNVAYNEGTKLVVGLFKQHIQEEGPTGLPATIAVDSRHPLASSVIEVLERATFTRVIRGRG